MKYYAILEPLSVLGITFSFSPVINRIEKPIKKTGLIASDSISEISDAKTFILIEHELSQAQKAELEQLGAAFFTTDTFQDWFNDEMAYSHIRSNPSGVRETVQLADGSAARVESVGFRTDYAAKRILLDVRITYADSSQREETLLANNLSRIPVSATETIGEYDYITTQVNAGKHPDQVQRETIQYRGSVAGGSRFEKR